MRQLTSLDAQFLALEGPRQTGHVAGLAVLDPSTQAQPASITQPAASANPLRPLLILTGAVAGVAVLCLLLVGSRSAAARRMEVSEDV